MKTFALISAAIVSFGIGGISFYTAPTIESGYAPSQEEKKQDSAQQQEEIKTKLRKAFMRGKLESNQKIVEGLSMKNFELISEGANGVKALVLGEHWFVIDTPEYKRFSKEMELAAGRLSQAAESKNLDAAALRYFDLTLTCLDCHGYIQGKKY